MPDKKLYDVVASLVNDDPTEASNTFKDLLNQRVEDAIKSYVTNHKLSLNNADMSITDTSEVQPTTPQVIDDVEAAKAREIAAWQAAQTPENIESKPDGLTDDHQVAIV